MRPSRKTAVARLRPLDYGFLFLSAALTVGSALWISGIGSESGSGPLYVQIRSDSGTLLYPLSEDQDIHVAGPAGVTWLRIEKGEVFAVESPGPRRIILQMGKIHQKGQWLASLPNKVFVRIVTASGDASREDMDAEVY